MKKKHQKLRDDWKKDDRCPFYRGFWRCLLNKGHKGDCEMFPKTITGRP